MSAPRGVEPVAQHEPLLVLQRAQRPHRLEVQVDGRRTPPDFPRERVNPERIDEVVLPPPDRPCELLGRSAGRGDLGLRSTKSSISSSEGRLLC